MRRRIFTLLLALAMVLMLLPNMALAAEAEGTPYVDGEHSPAGGTYTISYAEQLAALSAAIYGSGNGEDGIDYADTTFKLTQNIDLSTVCGKEVNGGTNWMPIGNDIFSFMGTFDGCGYKISGLYISSSNYDISLGLFGSIGRDGIVRNLGVDGYAGYSSATVGCLAGSNGGTIENCYNAGIAANDWSPAGGLVGTNGNGGTIINCYNTGHGGSSIFDAGGIAGKNYGLIKNCYSTGDVGCSGDSLGGIVGSNYGSGIVENCYNTGDLSAVSSSLSDRIGGIAGYNSGTIRNCYNIGILSAASNGIDLGGIVGKNYSDGYYERAKVENCYYLENCNAEGSNFSNSTGTAIDADSFGLRETFENWDFSAVWTMSTALNRPVLRWLPEAGSEVKPQKYGGGDGTESSPYLISSAEHLKALSETTADLGKHFKQTEDIDLSSVCGEELNGGTNWTPIGGNASYFFGTYDGDQHKVTGLYIKDPKYSHQGLFGWVYGGTVKNLSVFGQVIGSNSNIAGLVGENRGTIMNCSNGCTVASDNYNNVGGVVGVNYGKVTGCTNSGKVSGSDNVGGVVAANYGGTVEACSNTGDVSGKKASSEKSDFDDNVGGVVGYNTDGTITNCSNFGTVTGRFTAGGVVGYNIDTMTNCFNAGAVRGSDVADMCSFGGVVGRSIGTMTNCRNTGEVNSGKASYLVFTGGVAGDNGGPMRNCYNTGNVTGTDIVGGIAGGQHGEIVENCYNTGNVSGTDQVSGMIGGSYNGTIRNCYNIGKVTGQNRAAGALSGGNGYGTIANCYYLKSTASSGIWNSSGHKDIAGQAEKLTADDFRLTASFENWDFTDIWEMGVDADGNPVRPILTSNKEDDLSPLPKDSTGGSSGGNLGGDGGNLGGGSGGDDGGDNSDDGLENEPSPDIHFVDVPADGYYRNAVDWAVKKGIVAGTSATTFSPNATCTRGQIVTFLWRANGSPEPTLGLNPFKDIDPKAYYYKAVLWAYSKGIVSGTSATMFSPNASCTRAQTVTFLYRANGSPNVSGSGKFSDVSSGAYYADAVSWATSNGIVYGTSADKFSPANTCTRAQSVTFLYRNLQGTR